MDYYCVIGRKRLKGRALSSKSRPNVKGYERPHIRVAVFKTTRSHDGQCYFFIGIDIRHARIIGIHVSEIKLRGDGAIRRSDYSVNEVVKIATGQSNKGRRARKMFV